MSKDPEDGSSEDITKILTKELSKVEKEIKICNLNLK